MLTYQTQACLCLRSSNFVGHLILTDQKHRDKIASKLLYLDTVLKDFSEHS